MKLNIAKVLLVSAVALCAQRALAQSFSIGRFTVAGGDVSTSAGGTFALSGTIGQSDASPQPMVGGGFSLIGGVWSLFAVQTPGAPLLSVERQGEAVRVFWPLSAIGFVLDQSPGVTGDWSQVSFPYTTNSTGISISVPTTTGNKFYRLRKL